MKTKQEMIYDFMLVLAQSFNAEKTEILEYCAKEGIEATNVSDDVAEFMYLDACIIVDCLLKEFEDENI